MSDDPFEFKPPPSKRVTMHTFAMSDLAEFKPGYIINEPLNMIEVHFEDVAHKSVPLIDGVYHWIDKLVAFDDGRVVGLNFWIYKPPETTHHNDKQHTIKTVP